MILIAVASKIAYIKYTNRIQSVVNKAEFGLTIQYLSVLAKLKPTIATSRNSKISSVIIAFLIVRALFPTDFSH